MRFILLFTLSVVLAGCSVVVCPNCYEDGELDASAGDVFDAGPDLSEPDSSACTSCVADQHCDEANGRCVECLEDAHCPSNGTCRDGVCPDCVDDTECTSPNTPVCSESGPSVGRCVPCVGASDCDGIRVAGTDLNVCDDREGEPNICVACNGGEGECGDLVCDVQAQECSSQEPESAPTCAPCISSEQCRGDSVCVQEEFAGVPTGFYCLSPAGMGCSVPLIGDTSVWTSVEGEEVSVCHPGSTTCQGLRDDTIECDDSSTCGLPDVNDAVCVESTGRCAYLCVGTSDCASGETCLIEPPRVCD